MKIAIGIACNRQMQPKTVQSLLEMVANSDYELYFVIGSEGYTISENRAYIVAQARKNDCTHLFFVDDDMIFPKDTLKKLVEHGKDIIGIVAHSRMITEDTQVTLMDGKVLQKKDRPDKLFKVKAIGTGIMLINLEIFNKIDKPYFNTETHENGFTLMGEDSWFCRQAERKGIEIWCDPTIKILHIGDYNY